MALSLAQPPGEQQTAKMRTITDQMKRPDLMLIKVGNDRRCLMPADTLFRMRDGDPFLLSDWRRLTDLILPTHAPHTIVSAGGLCTLPPLKSGEIGIWLRRLPTQHSHEHKAWCITVHGLPNRTVHTYSVRVVIAERETSRASLKPSAFLRTHSVLHISK
jgi:hypothetical protein